MPISDQHSLNVVSHGVRQTQRLGSRLAQLMSGGEVLLMSGDLGTGKTCLIQGIGMGLGIKDRITSPTFTLANEYRGNHLMLYHIDLYRIVESKAALSFGLDEYLYGSGICTIEWAERIEPLWPADYLSITLRHVDENKRGLTLRAEGERYDNLLQQFKHAAFGL